MAYGSAKGRIFRGDIYAADDPNQDTYIDWGNDFISFGVGGVKVLNVSASNTLVQVLGHVSASGNFTGSNFHAHGIISASSNITASGHVSASAFYGDGQYLKNVGGTPGGANTNIQFNNGGAFGGSNSFKWEDAAQILTVSGAISASANLTASNVFVPSGNSIFFDAAKTYKITNNGTNLDINGDNIILNANTKVSASGDLTASAFYGRTAHLSSSNADGKELFFGTGTSRKIGTSIDGSDDYLVMANTAGGVDVSASEGVTLQTGKNTNVTAYSAGNYKFQVADATFATVFYADNNGNVSASSNITASGHVSASAFYGDGQYLKNIGGGGGGGGIFTTLGSGNAYTTSSIRVGSAGEPSASLHVSGTGAGAGPVFRLDSSVAGGTPLFFVSGSGRVGIGTDTPGIGGSSDTKLDVQGHLTIGKSGTAYIFNNNDADTYIKLGGAVPPGTDGMQFFVGGKRMLMLDENGTDRVVLGNSSSDFTIVSGSLIVSGTAHLSSSGYDGKDLFLGNGTSRQIGARFAGDDYLAIQNTNGRTLLSSSEGHEIVGGGSDGLGLFGVSGVYLYGDEDGNKLSGSILKSGIISGSRVTVAGNVSCSNVWVRPGNSVIFDAANTYKITNNGTNLDINGDNIILNANTKVSASAPLSASAFYGSTAHLSSSNADGKELFFGTGRSRKIGTSIDGADDYLVMANTAGGVDVSASEGVTLITGKNTNVTAYSAGSYKFQLADASFATVFYADNNGNVSASSNITASGHVSASAFYGDGQYLKNIGGGSGGGIFTTLGTGNAYTTSSIRVGRAGEPSASIYVSDTNTSSSLTVDKNHGDLAATTLTGLEIDFDKSGSSTSNNTMYGLKVDMDNTTATNGANSMYGLHVTPTLTHAADAGDSLVYGAFLNAQAGTNGTGIATGARIEATGGDLNYGIVIDCENGANNADLRIESSAVPGDYFQIQTTTDGATTISTVDSGGSAADLTCSIDGDILLDPVGGKVTLDGDLYLNQYIYHKGDTDTFINFTDDDINITVGNINFMDFTQDTESELTINEAAQNLNVRIEGEADSNLFFTDGSESKVGIGTNSPQAKLHVSASVDGSLLLLDGAKTAPVLVASGSGKVGVNTTSPKTSFDVHFTGSGNPINLGNDKGGGEVVYFGTSSVSGLQTGALYYLNAKGGWASASAAQTGSSLTSGGGQSQLLAISLGSNPSSDGMLTRGFVDAETYFVGAYKTGSAVYVSTASAKFKSVAPTASNNYVRVIGYATTAPNVIYFNPDSTYVEIA